MEKRIALLVAAGFLFSGVPAHAAQVGVMHINEFAFEEPVEADDEEEYGDDDYYDVGEDYVEDDDASDDVSLATESAPDDNNDTVPAEIKEFPKKQDGPSVKPEPVPAPEKKDVAATPEKKDATATPKESSVTEVKQDKKNEKNKKDKKDKKDKDGNKDNKEKKEQPPAQKPTEAPAVPGGVTSSPANISVGERKQEQKIYLIFSDGEKDVPLDVTELLFCPDEVVFGGVSFFVSDTEVRGGELFFTAMNSGETVAVHLDNASEFEIGGVVVSVRLADSLDKKPVESKKPEEAGPVEESAPVVEEVYEEEEYEEYSEPPASDDGTVVELLDEELESDTFHVLW